MTKKYKESILVVQTGKIGDSILTTPLFNCLKKKFPDCKLTVLAGKLGSIIPMNHTSVDEVLIYDKKLLNSVKLFLKLKQTFYDKWIDIKPEYSRTSLLLKKAGRFAESYGFTTGNNKFDFDLNKISSSNHMTSLCLRPLSYLGCNLDCTEGKPSVCIPSDALNRIEDFLKADTRPYIVFNLSSGKKQRNWKVESLPVIYNILKKSTRQICVYSEKDENIYDFLKSEAGEIPEKYTGGFFDICALIMYSAAVLTPDTSIVHVASCFNIPVVGIYNNVVWNLERFAPLSDRNTVLQSDSENNIDVNPVKVAEAVKGILRQE